MSNRMNSMNIFGAMFPEKNIEIRETEEDYHQRMNSCSSSKEHEQIQREFNQRLCDQASDILKAAKELDLEVPFSVAKAMKMMPKNPAFYHNAKLLTYGHGGNCVNCGKNLAVGEFYVVVDSDDSTCSCLKCLRPTLEIDNERYLVKECNPRKAG